MSNLKNIIAVVDGDSEIRASLETLLLAYGYDVETFDSAEAFLARASTCRASCLIVEFHLGDITGVELAYQLAADGFTFPMVLMTGHRNASIERQASDADGVAILDKPFSARALIDAIKKATR